MGLILDTCIFIQVERNDRLPTDQWKTYGEVCISAITVSELLVGVHRANTKARYLKRSAFVETILAEVPIVDFTAEIARLHAELHAHLIEQKQPIGAHDLIIAATALTHGHALLTTNHNEFNRVPGLKVLS